jgi:VanZ family protein
MSQATAPRQFLFYHLPAVVYAGLIIGLSSLTNIHLPKTQFVELDKVIHFAEYGLFAWLVSRSTSHLHRAVGVDESSFLALGFVTMFAFADEFYQSFIPGRQSDTADFLTDVAAAIVVVAVVRLVKRPAQQIIA